MIGQQLHLFVFKNVFVFNLKQATHFSSCCFHDEGFHLFGHLGPAPHQTAFPELLGADPRCLQQKNK